MRRATDNTKITPLISELSKMPVKIELGKKTVHALKYRHKKLNF